jgi:hypothetical protein
MSVLYGQSVGGMWKWEILTDGSGDAREPVLFAVFEPFPRNVVALLAPHHHDVVCAELTRGHARVFVVRDRRRRLRVPLFEKFLLRRRRRALFRVRRFRNAGERTAFRRALC